MCAPMIHTGRARPGNAPTAPARLVAGAACCEVVDLRHRLLDEPKRRDPHGIHRWLQHDPRAGRDPGRHPVADAKTDRSKGDGVSLRVGTDAQVIMGLLKS
jgi:hypothetical protein